MQFLLNKLAEARMLAARQNRTMEEIEEYLKNMDEVERAAMHRVPRPKKYLETVHQYMRAKGLTDEFDLKGLQEWLVATGTAAYEQAGTKVNRLIPDYLIRIGKGRYRLIGASRADDYTIERTKSLLEAFQKDRPGSFTTKSLAEWMDTKKDEWPIREGIWQSIAMMIPKYITKYRGCYRYNSTPPEYNRHINEELHNNIKVMWIEQTEAVQRAGMSSIEINEWLVKANCPYTYEEMMRAIKLLCAQGLASRPTPNRYAIKL